MKLTTQFWVVASVSVTLINLSCNNEKDSDSPSVAQVTAEGEEVSGPTSAEMQQWEETLRNLKAELTTEKVTSHSDIFGKTTLILGEIEIDSPSYKIWKKAMGYFAHLEEVKLSHRKLINKLVATDYPEAQAVNDQVKKFYDSLEEYHKKMNWVSMAIWDYKKEKGIDITETLDLSHKGFKDAVSFQMERIKKSQPSAVAAGEAHVELLELLNDLIGAL